MSAPSVDQLWRFALAAVPMVLVIGVLCRVLPCRPSTRHSLWLVALLMLVVVPFLPQAPMPDLALLGEEDTAAFLPMDPPADRNASDPGSAGRSRRAAVLDRRTPGGAGLGTGVAMEGADGASSASARRSGLTCDPAGEAEACATPTTDAPGGRRPMVAGRGEVGTAQAGGAGSRALQTPGRPARTTGDGSGYGVPRRDGMAVSRPREQADGGEIIVDAAVPMTAGRRNALGVAAPAATAGAHGAGMDAAGVPPEWVDVLTETLGQWAVSLGGVRDAVMSLPPIPASIWAGGIAVIALVMLWRAVAFRKLLRQAAPASKATVASVKRAALALGLARAPEVSMVEARISPMVWCGRAPRLLLPAALWEQLDDVGHDAVVFHELAHLRRRDHWVCWLGMMVGCLYWWHPIVWWIRRQLREEADLCCDVWVTSLMPTARREYATALLETKRFTSTLHLFEPAVGLVLSPIRTKRFARRLTMVMSQQLTPKLTLNGVLLACVLAIGAWLVTPTLASPGDEGRTKAAPPSPPAAPAPPVAGTTADFYVLKDLDALKHLSLDDRLGRLEQQLQVLMQKLEKWSELADVDLPELKLERLGEIEHLSQLQGLPQRLQQMAQAQAGTAYEGALRAFQCAATGLPSPPSPPLPPSPAELMIRSYELPEGKLAALTELMIRPDVPVLVSPGEDHIDVHGTPQQHIIFEAFCLMVDGEEQVETYKLSEGKREAVLELMIRSDVPIRVSEQPDGIKVFGTALEQRVFKAFVDMIDPKTGPKDAPTLRVIPRAGTVEKKAKQYELKAKGQMHQLGALRARLQSLEKQAARQEANAEQFRMKAERLEEKLEEIEEQADDLEEAAEDLEGKDRLEAVSKLNQLLLKAAQIENEIRYLEAQAEAVEMQAEVLYEEAEKVESRIEEIEEAIEDLEEERDDD